MIRREKKGKEEEVFELLATIFLWLWIVLILPMAGVWYLITKKEREEARFPALYYLGVGIGGVCWPVEVVLVIFVLLIAASIVFNNKASKKPRADA